MTPKRLPLLVLFLLLPLSPLIAQDALPDNFDVQGHRGARGLKPENTLPAFETALDLRVTTLEMDLHFTSDGMVVVWHDERITNDKCGLNPDVTTEAPDPDSPIIQGDLLLISALTWEQVQAYRCDRNPEPGRFPQQNSDPTTLAGDHYGIVRLDDIFTFVETYVLSEEKTAAQRENAGSVRFNIETKRVPEQPRYIGDNFDGRHPGAFELAILDVIGAHDLQDRVIIQSFDHRSLWAVHSVNNTMMLAALTIRTRPDLADMAENGASIWSPNAQDLTPALLQQAHDVGLRVIPWTVNEEGEMRRLIEMGVDGLITDRPDRLLRDG
jgi:glycerophosphoryl diester phosphodiesterase